MILRKPVEVVSPEDGRLSALYDQVHMAFGRAGLGSKPPRNVQVGLNLWQRIEDNGEIVYVTERPVGIEMAAYSSVSMGDRPDGVRLEGSDEPVEKPVKRGRRSRE